MWIQCVIVIDWSVVKVIWLPVCLSHRGINNPSCPVCGQTVGWWRMGRERFSFGLVPSGAVRPPAVLSSPQRRMPRMAQDLWIWVSREREREGGGLQLPYHHHTVKSCSI